MIGQHPELCHLFNEWRGDVPEGGWAVSLKVDGWRCLWIDGEFRTRNGQPLHAADHFKPVMRLMEQAAGTRLFLDMEYQVDGSLAATKAHCERGWKDGSKRGKLHLFDAVPAANWFRGDCAMPLVDRFAWLADIAEKAHALPLAWEIDPVFWDRVEVLGQVLMHDAGEIQALAEQVWALGLEGLVLKRPGSLYQRRRSDEWKKVKQKPQRAQRPIAA